MIKAGGSIRRSLLEMQEMPYTPPAIQQFFRARMRDYFVDSDIIYTNKYVADTSSMKRYRKKRVHVGYVMAKDVMPSQGTCIIRTLEGDVDVEVMDDTVIAIGIRGEIYPMSWEDFIKKYEITTEPYEYPGNYKPSIKDIDGKSREFLQFAHSCVTTDKVEIFAKELKNRTKIFTKWDSENYYLGKPGDYMAVSSTDNSDVYIVERNIFHETYDEI